MACADVLTFVSVRPDCNARASQRGLIQEHLNKRQKHMSKVVKWRQTIMVGQRPLKVKNQRTNGQVVIDVNSVAQSTLQQRVKPDTSANTALVPAFSVRRWRPHPSIKSNSRESTISTNGTNSENGRGNADKSCISPSRSKVINMYNRHSPHWSVFANPITHRVDPFARYADDALICSIEPLIDHAVRHFWPGLYPSQRHEANAIFLPHLSSSRLAYCTYLMNISLSYDYLHGQHVHHKVYSILRLQCMYEASRIVQEIINALPDNPRGELICDNLIGTVCCLSSASTEFISPKRTLPSRFRSPLATAQHLDMWGTAGFSQPHRLAVVRLVQLKGGLHKLAFSGLAAIVKLADLIDSSVRMEKPMLAYPDETLPQYAGGQSIIQPDSSNGYEAVLQQDELGIAFTAAASATAQLETWVKDHQPADRLMYICDARSRAHHLALCVNRAFDSSLAIQYKPTCSQILHEITRLSLLIYNNIVLFPLPSVTRVDTSLSVALQRTCSQALQQHIDLLNSHPELMLWTLLLGGISDSKDTCRAWYQANLGQVTEKLCLNTWAELEKCLSNFLWYDVVLNEEAMKFWSETVISRTDHAHAADVIDHLHLSYNHQNYQ